MKLSLVIPTLNAGPKWSGLLESLCRQTMQCDFRLVIDSGSIDQTIEVSKQHGYHVHSIRPGQFNHGATREMTRKLNDADIVIFITQDVIPADNTLLEKLVEPLTSGRASFSYARQIPRNGADIFEAFPRWFNYPAGSHLRGIEDVHKYGVYTFFCSNSCAAYLNSALDDIGGFRPTLTNEDYFASARLLQKGYKLAYVAEAIVEHSHSYTLLEEFKRYFDTGYVRAENPWVQDLVGQAERRGKDYFSALMKEISKNKPPLIPYALLNTFVKFLGYRIGFLSLNAPKWWKKVFSGQRYYWDSEYLERGNSVSKKI